MTESIGENLAVEDILVEKLQSVGLSEIDAEIYINLLKLRKQRDSQKKTIPELEQDYEIEPTAFSPNEILNTMKHLHKNRERWKLYEGLNRLVKINFVRSFGEKGKPVYVPESPEIVLTRIRTDLEIQLGEVEELNDLMRHLDPGERNEIVETLVGYDMIWEAIERAARATHKTARCIFPPDYAYKPTFRKIGRILFRKAIPNVEIFLDIERHHADLVKKFTEFGFELHQIEGIKPFPLGLFIFDNTHIMVLNGRSMFDPEYTIGTIVENASAQWSEGHAYYFDWYKSTADLFKGGTFEQVL